MAMGFRLLMMRSW